MSSPLPIAATFSKDSSFWGTDFYPSRLVRGEAGHVFSDTGKEYIDWVSGLGAVLLGYSHIGFIQAVQKQVALGVGFSLPHYLEQEVAEMLVDLLGRRVPGWSPDSIQVRFGKTGTDATTIAVRLARAVSGKFHILHSGYAGWSDWSVSATPPAWGIIPEESDYIHKFDFGRLDQLAAYRDGGIKIAAVILEHPLVDPEPDWYNNLRTFCDSCGALLIMDEVVTGFRYALGGVCELYKIWPDIVCYGKALGNGLPISCIVARKDIMKWFARDDPVFVSSTNFGDAISLAGAKAVLEALDNISAVPAINWISLMGTELVSSLHNAGWKVIGHPQRSLLDFVGDDYLKAFFIREMRNRGILMNRPNFPNLGHTRDDITKTGGAAQDVADMACSLGPDGIKAEMEGKLPRVLFRKR